MKVYSYVEQMPQLVSGGGNHAIIAAIQELIQYTPLALHKRVEGRVVVSFTVDAQGEVMDVKVVKGLGSGLDEETARAMYHLPRFVPGRQDGQAVAVSFRIPITFQLPASPDPAP
ncbi:energy transducer TonB [Hymenobacter terrigena]